MSLFTNLQGNNGLEQVAALYSHGRAFSHVLDEAVQSLNDLNADHNKFQELSSIHKARKLTAHHVKVYKFSY